MCIAKYFIILEKCTIIKIGIYTYMDEAVMKLHTEEGSKKRSILLKFFLDFSSNRRLNINIYIRA